MLETGTLLILVGVFVVGQKTFLRRKADVNSAVYLNTNATVTYQANDKNYTDQSNTAKIRKVNLLGLNVSQRGRTWAAEDKFNLEISNNSDGDKLGSLDFAPDAGGQAQPDWTNLPGIDPDQKYDLRISAPGRLARIIRDSQLDSTATIQINALAPGDLDGDGTINYHDYVAWKAKYGQKVTAGEPADFNGDGKVDFVDFALSFGSRCYNANENNQDVQCNQ